MDPILFGDQNLEKLFGRFRLGVSVKNERRLRVVFVVAVCWLPLLVLSIIHGNFWTGSNQDSFLSSLESQTRFLISLPILMLAEPLVSRRLMKTLAQFIDGGMVPKTQLDEFHSIIRRNTAFLQSQWTDLLLLAICYIQVVAILFFEAQYTSVASWQFDQVDGEQVLNIVGKWSVGVSRPITLYFVYRWVLRVFVWGKILAKIARLDLRLFPFHADKVGGLGFLSFSISYFAPMCFAISVTLAGNAADLMLVDGLKLAEFRMLLLGYMVFVTLFFSYPLFVFSRKLLEFKEKCIFELYDGAQYIYNKVDLKTINPKLKGTTNPEDIAYLASIADFNAVLENVLQMRSLPFQLRSLFPLWVLTLIPYLFVVLIEVPISEIISRLISTMF